MAFTSNNTNIEVTAKLTPYGRQQLLAGTSGDLIKKFTLGDSDANYFSTQSLNYGEVPSNTGELGFDNTITNSVHSLVGIKNKVYYNESGVFYKDVEANSSKVLSSIKYSDVNNYVSNSDDFILISKDDFNNSDLNLLSSIYQPILDTEKFNFSGVTNANGGYSDTALADFSAEDVLLINISGSTYGELINGRNFNVNITTSGGTYNIYSTFQRSTVPNTTQDTNVREISTKSKTIGDNIVFLFSDQIQKPNSNASKSWATGYNMIKSFSAKGKEFFNLTDNTSLGLVRDKIVGYVLLDKGLVVITNSTIVNEFNTLSDSVDMNYGSVFTEVSQEITCVVERGEFSVSTNTTHTEGENIRISEIGLYDANLNLIAIGKINKHLELAANQFMAISVKITV